MTTRDEYLLGVDAGGTKTLGALASRDGATVRVVRAGPGNAAVLGVAGFAARLRSLIDELLAGDAIAAIREAVVALAGIGRPEDRARIRAACADVGLSSVEVLTDGELHYEAALGDAVGIVLAAGTGTVCTVRDATGAFRQFGGWGYVLGDEGSGYTIGREAIRRALFDAESDASASPLAAALLDHFGVDRPAALVSATYAADTPQAFVARAADVVVRLAREEDPVAVELIDAAARDLVALGRRGAAQLGGTGPHALGLRGGLLFADSPLLEAFRREASSAGVRFDYREPLRSPLAAALAHAKSRTGDALSVSFCERIEQLRAD